MIALVTALIGCFSAPVPSQAPVPVADVPLELVADLAVPVHPDLDLGALEPAADPSGYFPRTDPGRWTAHRVWTSKRDADWEPSDVLIGFDASTAEHGEWEMLRAVGDGMRSFSAHRLGISGQGWGVLAAKPSGHEEFSPLANAELLIAPSGTVFQSSWTREPVTVEIVGVQSVTVPAGTFKSLRVRRSWALAKRSTVEDAWWTADHGLVAWVQRVQTLDTPEARMRVLAAEGRVSDRSELRPTWTLERAAIGLPE